MEPSQPNSSFPDLRNPSGVSGQATVEQRTCRRHGPYNAQPLPGIRPLPGRLMGWNGCPICERERREEEDRERAAEEASKLARRMSMSGLLPRMLAASFGNFTCDTDAQISTLKACRTFAEELNPDGGGGLWLIGPPGTGKTHLGSSMVQHVIRDKRLQACLFSARQIINMQRASWDKDRQRSSWDDPFLELSTTEEVVEFMGRVSLLVLDEIGVGFHSNAEQVQLYDVIDMRYQLCRPTVVISNLPPAEMKTALGERSYDRLREGSRVFTCNWPSVRGVNRAPRA